jgi:lipid-A-disaccharide synthase
VMGSVLLVAAEASSALFAQRLLEHWKKENQNIQVFGIGSDAMEAIGFERLGNSEDMAVMGLAEIVEHYNHIKTVFHRLIAEAEKRRPDVVVLMDYPGFNLRFAKKMKALGIPVVYYITPQIWAWRKGRIRTIQECCDQVFVLFPFELTFFEKAGVRAQFVGHPLLDEMDPKYLDPGYRKIQRNKFGISDDQVVIGLMPGSRRGEIERHLDIQIEVARRLYKNHPNVRILLMCAPTVDKEKLQEKMQDVRFPYMLLKNEPFEMIHLADYILAASGTATLQVALLEKPMVVMYKFKWLTGVIAKLIVRGVRYFCIVNLIAGREIVPERWQGPANPDELTKLMARYLEEPGHTHQVRTDLHKIHSQLGNQGATLRVAQALQPYFKGSKV